jgi:hypothetical protein
MQEIFDTIDEYAKAYLRLENIQRSCTNIIPIGDQKTGVIAEFYARIYAKDKFSGATFKSGSASQHAWDIKIIQDGQPEVKVQVKAVSEHSKTSRISPIHPGWNQLWLMRLDALFRPLVLWIIEAQNVPWSNKLQKNRTMPKFGKLHSSGSVELRSGKDETEYLLDALNEAIGNLQQ